MNTAEHGLLDASETVLEEIRLAAMEAFFSLRHGGAEIGGVLFGTQSAGRVRILAQRQLDCEHALGPSFTLSLKDHASLTELLNEGSRDLRAQGLAPVGWYHSHTRSEIFLSAEDLEIHNRYFPESWQVALVVRPHAMQPMRAGFFFREAGGALRTESSDREFLLAPAAPAPVESAPLADIPLPAFLLPPPQRSRQSPWCTVIVMVLGAAVLACAGLFTLKDTWMPALALELAHNQPPSVSLLTYDLAGQLQIRWDRAAEPVRTARSGTLEIVDASVRTVATLDRQRLLSGTFSYVRQTARVDVHLTLDQPNGKKIEEFAGFLGSTPPTPVPDAAVVTAELRKELEDQAVRMRQLERDVAGLRGLQQ
jgi:proteasome lid subunit RPN8/RPN11